MAMTFYTESEALDRVIGTKETKDTVQADIHRILRMPA